jgi:hypothetical protein
MTITAVSADGVKHVFPNGTGQDVIGKVMKTYAAAHPPPSTLKSAAEGASAGIGRAVLGTEQLAGKGLSAIGDLYGPAGGIDRRVGGFLSADAAKRLATVAQQEAPYSAAHPIATGVGEVAGALPAAAIAPEGEMAPAATLVGKGLQAARIGGVAGVEQPIDPNKTGADYWKAKGFETGINVAASEAFGAGAEGLGIVKSGFGKWAARNKPDFIKSEATRKLMVKVAQDEKAGGAKVDDIIKAVTTNHALGVPTSLLEAGGRKVRGAVGAAARGLGAGDAILEYNFGTNKVAGRLTAVKDRLVAAARTAFDSPETSRDVHDALKDSQIESSAPLYAEAMNPNILSPMEDQFKPAFEQVSQAKKAAAAALDNAKNTLTQAVDKLNTRVSTSVSNMGANDAAMREVSAAKAGVDSAQAALKDVEARHAEILTRLQQAVAADASGVRGIWSPHIAVLLKNSNVLEGVKQGLEIMKNESDAQYIPFKPMDYAVTGVDEKGDPIISGTPNMRLLDAAKKGLDAMIEAKRDTLTGQIKWDAHLRTIEGLRVALLNEVDRINPAYKAAREAWAGPAASLGAMIQGSKIMDSHPEDVKKIFEEMSPAEQQHYKIGAAQAYIDALSKRGVVSSAVRDLTEDETALWARRRLMPIFDNKKKLDDFLSAVQGERDIYGAKQSILGGSATAGRQGEDVEHGMDDAVHAVRGVIDAATGNHRGALASALHLVKKLNPLQNAAVNEEIVRLATDPEKALSLLKGDAIPLPARASMATPLTAALGAATAETAQQHER